MENFCWGVIVKYDVIARFRLMIITYIIVELGYVVIKID